jgi:hypothetical protein
LKSIKIFGFVKHVTEHFSVFLKTPGGK